MKHDFKFLFLLYLKAENFIMRHRNELQEEINIASKASEVHKLSEEIVL